MTDDHAEKLLADLAACAAESDDEYGKRWPYNRKVKLERDEARALVDAWSALLAERDDADRHAGRAIKRAEAAEATLTRIRDILPYHGCSVCRGAERGPDGVPCPNCGGTGEEPSLENLVESNLRYLDSRDQATLTRYREALERILTAEDRVPHDLSCGCTYDSGPYRLSCDEHDHATIARAALDGPKHRGSCHIFYAENVCTCGALDGPKEEEK